MNYKLSIEASRQTIEKTFQRNFRFPNVYRTHKTVDGSKETTLPIITSEKSDNILQGIWGILPHKYESDWKKFQKSLNTLTVKVKDLESQLLYKESFFKRRCLILVTGIYFSYLNEGVLKTVLVKEEDNELFTLAGVYNVTNDGFVTCSIINTKKKERVIANKSLHLKMPVIINKAHRTTWLNTDAEMETIKTITNNANEMDLYCAKES